MTDASGSSGPPGPPGSGNLPARRLSSQELEAVIRRAVEIQSAAGTPDEGITEGEVLRIGQELGLDPVSVRRAITDVRGQAPPERGMMVRAMGPGVIRAARTVRRPGAAVGLLLEEYLLRCEYMLVQRRFPDRTRYVRGTGVAAVLGRASRKFGASHAAMDLAQLDVAISALDADSCLVELTVDTSGVRAGMAAGAATMGIGAGVGITAAVLATPIIDPLALLSLPAMLGSWLGMRGIYGAVQSSTQDKLESCLDRVEHNELNLPTPRGARGPGGPGGPGGGGFTLGGGGFNIRLGGPPRGPQDR
ncbi:MAG TPA: hypothetical protein VF665_17875 [Longimicrobium sp.]|uniref:hypothetical protein n=1 Tax=Longimicrobium sp. TaxID=2029185 RepID=UPI002EDA836E